MIPKSPLRLLMSGMCSGVGRIALTHLIHEGHDLHIFYRKEADKEQLSQFENVSLYYADFNNLFNLQKFFDSYQGPPFDAYIGNAGIYPHEYKQSDNHIESCLQVNSLSHYYIIKQCLKNKLLIPGESKVILSSSALHYGNIHWSDLEFSKDFNPFEAYKQSKLALLMMNTYFAYKNNICAVSWHPGPVKTNLTYNNSSKFQKLFISIFSRKIEDAGMEFKRMILRPADTLYPGHFYFKGKLNRQSPQSLNIEKAQLLSEHFDRLIAKALFEEFSTL